MSLETAWITGGRRLVPCKAKVLGSGWGWVDLSEAVGVVVVAKTVASFLPLRRR
jgi:hypothetical protein